MKKSDLKQFQANLAKASQPPTPKKTDDTSDELSKMFDDGTQLPSTREAPVTRVTPVSRVTQDAAPKRDFTRAANSIVRDAVPAGLFSGKGKQLYDYLYSRTRGAVVPTLSVRLPKSAVMRGADMTRPTYRTQIARLVSVGLVKVEEIGGDHLGNVYTVYLPEEAANPGYPGNPTYPSSPAKELDGQPGQETYPGNPGLSVDYQRTSGDPKTLSLRQDRSDDEPAAASTTSTPENRAFAELNARFAAASTEITGKSSTPVDAARWGELADVLIAELRIAAARTTVSNVPAFLAEHLRRRLWKLDKKQASQEGRELPDSSPAVAQNAPSDCPRCKGSGWEYPNGPDGGVRRCKHD